MSKPDSTRWQKWRLLAFFAVIGLLTRLVLLTVPVINIDEASYAVGSWELLNGKLLYLDFGDNKPPLIYVYYGFAQLLFGRGMLSVRLLTSLCTIPLTAFGISAFFDHERRGLVAGLVYLVYSASFRGHDMIAVNCEILMLLPLAWAVVSIRDFDSRPSLAGVAASGALIGMATLVKYQAASVLAAVAIPVAIAALQRSGWRRALSAAGILILGFAAPLAVTYLIFAWVDGTAGLLYWNVTHNVDYLTNPVTVPDVLARAGTYLVPFLCVTAPLWVAAVASARLVESSYRRQLMGGLLVTSVFSITLGFRFFPHYFVQLYLPLALASAPALETVFRRPYQQRRAWLFAGYSIVVFVAFMASNVNRYLRHTDSQMETNPVFVDVAERLRADSCYGFGPLFVWGSSAPMFHFYSQLPVASRFFFPESPLVAYFSGNPRATVERASLPLDELQREWDWLIQDLRQNRPTFILDTASADLDNWRYYPLYRSKRLLRFVRQSYVPIGIVDGVEIYRRRACDPAAPELDALNRYPEP